VRIKLTSVFVDDLDKALRFYTDVLGFRGKRRIPVGKYDFVTVVSPQEPDGTELLLEPDENPAAKAFTQAMYEQSIPRATFFVDDVQREYDRLKQQGVRFIMEPTRLGQQTTAVFDDTCGNYIQIVQPGATGG
jgi:catechol 2,3-dioxygenase-like lactoylglutathione lyase family enzyme